MQNFLYSFFLFELGISLPDNSEAQSDKGTLIPEIDKEGISLHIFDFQSN